MNVTMKRIVVYVFGLFFLSLGVSFSIQAGLGVSPVSSLAYAFSLTTGLSVGIMTVVANLLFIIVQAILNKHFEVKESIVQLIIAFLFGGFMDATLMIAQMFPSPETLVSRFIYLIISLYIVAVGLLGYFTSKLPLMPYDALTYAISARFKLQFTKAKITSDLLNVIIACAVCLIFIHSFGAVGIGTLLAAYFIGKILGWMMGHYQKTFQNWIYNHKQKTKENYQFKEKTEDLY